MLLLALVILSINDQMSTCQVASVHWWHNEESMTSKSHRASVSGIAVLKLLNKVAACVMLLVVL